MPGKYSYNAVLAQYSSQGVISIPNDDHLGYFGAVLHPRAHSSAAPRQRTSSNSTRSTYAHSTTNASLAAKEERPRSRQYNLTPAPSSVRRRRVVIVDSDTDDNSSNIQSSSVRARGDAASLCSTEAKPRALKHAKEVPALRKSQDGSTPTERIQIHETVRPSQATAGRTAGQKVAANGGMKRAGGVKAFMQERHNTEQLRSSGPIEDFDDDAGLTLRDMLQSRPLQAETRQLDPAIPLSVQEFLDIMPVPPDDGDQESTDKLVNDQHTVEKPLLDRALPAERDNRHSTREGSRYTRQSATLTRVGSTNKRVASPPEYQKAIPEGQHGPASEPRRALKRQPRKLEKKPQAGATSSHMNRTEQSKSPSSKERGKPAAPSSRPAMLKLGDSAKEQTHSHPPGRELPSISSPARGPIRSSSRTMQSRSRLRPAAHAHSHSAADSLHTLSSLGSLGLDDLGIIEEGSTGQTTSTSSVTPGPKTPKSATHHSWNLPQIEQGDDVGPDVEDVFQDLRNHKPVFTSDEEDEDDGGPAPRLQTLAEDVTLPSKEFGNISSGRDLNISLNDADEMSEISAVYPPDIGRSKYGGEGSGSRELAMESMMTGNASHISRAETLKVPRRRGLIDKLRFRREK